MSPYQAYAGFQVMEGSSGSPVAVATGNWGCGAFKGDSRLKVFIFLYSPFDIWLISLVLNCLYIAFYTNINIYQLWSWFFTFGFFILSHLFSWLCVATLAEMLPILHLGIRNWGTTYPQCTSSLQRIMSQLVRLFAFYKGIKGFKKIIEILFIHCKRDLVFKNLKW